MTTATTTKHQTDLVASIPFVLWHLLVPIGFVFLPFRLEHLLVIVGAYYLRMFGITAGYHRYFSHRAFKTNRVFQFFLAFLAQTSAQKGALWWAANHRHHHRYSDMEEDIHSPARKGFWWSHVGWVLTKTYEPTNYGAVKDLARYPELVWLNEHFMVPPMVCLAITWAIGGVEWAFYAGVVSTVLLWHGTFTINSLSHIFGKRRYVTTDTSRNNFFLALLTCGEGWHNNHHFHQNTANQGWFWWEIDVTFYVLKVLSWFRIVTDLRLPSEQTKYCFRNYTAEQKAQLAAETRFNAWRSPPPASKPIETPEQVPVLGLTPAPLLKR